MNKILNINLGGYALTIDDDAYEYLSAYLESIRRRFSESEGRDEIIQDIEARLGELIHAGMGNRTIVMLPDVQAAADIMGKPEDFGGEPTPETGRTASTGSRPFTANTKGGAIRPGKRLFRDTEDASVGGVCSGLAAYVGMADPVWMRLIFVVLTLLSAGFWIPAYLLLWILVPPARTAADRLAMRGERIDMDNIAREIEQGFDRLGNQIGGQKKSGDGSFSAFMGKVVAIIGQLFGLAVRLVAKFAAVIAVLLGIVLFFVLIGSWIAGFWGVVTAAPYFSYASPFSEGTTYFAFGNLFLLLGIPIIALCLLFSRLIFKTRTPTWLSVGLGTLWSVALCCVITLVAIGAKQYRQSGSSTKTIDLSALPSDTLRVEWAGRGGAGDDYRNTWWMDNDDEVRLNNDRLEINNMMHIEVRRSSSGRFECGQIIKARGSSGTEASMNAEGVVFNAALQGNVLRLPTDYSIPQGKKWRVQEVKVIIGVPVGKYVVFGKEVNHRVYDANYADYEDTDYINDHPDKVYRMTSDGLVCADCPAFGDRDYRERDGRDYEDFILEGKFDVEIRRGEDFKMRLEGDAGALEKIRTEDKLTLRLTDKGSVGNRVKVFIETPVFTTLVAENSGDITIRGFEEGRASITAKGDSHIRAYLDVSAEFDVSLSGKSLLELTGKGNSLEATLTDGATLDASGWRADAVQVSASDGSKARVYATGQAIVMDDATSEVKVSGNAHIERKDEHERNEQ